MSSALVVQECDMDPIMVSERAKAKFQATLQPIPKARRIKEPGSDSASSSSFQEPVAVLPVHDTDSAPPPTK